MKRHFEMQLSITCVNYVGKVRAQGTMTSTFLFLFYLEITAHEAIADASKKVSILPSSVMFLSCLRVTSNTILPQEQDHDFHLALLEQQTRL